MNLENGTAVECSGIPGALPPPNKMLMTFLPLETDTESDNPPGLAASPAFDSLSRISPC